MNARCLLGLWLTFGWLSGAAAWLAAGSAPTPARPDPAKTEAVLQTDQGDIVLRFFPEAAPRHVDYFLKLAGEGFYDGGTFFRIIRYGIIQAGDPLSRDPAARERYGTGGLMKLKAEFNDHPCRRGAVAAVLVPGNPDSAGSQFFICVTDQLQLNRQFTVFGELAAGMSPDEAISLTPTDEKAMATERVPIHKVVLRPITEPAYRDAGRERLGRCRATIVTDLGEIELGFYPDLAPEHIRQFLNFAAAGLYDGTDFHRVVPGFVIQGGAMSGRQPPVGELLQSWLKPLQAEFGDKPHLRGTLSMARADDPNSGMDSFFICLGPQPSLDGKYTVFGQVLQGLEVVDRIAAQPLGEGEHPRERIAIRRITVREEPAPPAGQGGNP